MCSRVQLLGSGELEDTVGRLAGQLGLEGVLVPEGGDPGRSEARPGFELPALRRSDGGADDVPGLLVTGLSWGFPVDWQSGLVYNTRIESALAGAAMWAEPLAAGRCVVPVAAYFEPSDSETANDPSSGRRVKRTYRFSMPGGEPMLLAGVSDGGCVSIVTTEPNATMRPIHRRMPLMLHADEVAGWFGDDFAELADRSGFVMRAEPEGPAGPAQERLF